MILTTALSPLVGSSQQTDSLEFYKGCTSEEFAHSKGIFVELESGFEEIEDQIKSIGIKKDENRKIEITFRVNCTGKAADFRLIKNGMADDFEKQVFKLISSLQKWKPATLNGKKVNSIHILNIETKRGKVDIDFAGYSPYLNWSDTKFKNNL